MKTSEMIAMLEKNPKLKFQYNTGCESGVMSCIDGDIKLIEYNGKPANYSQYLILHSGYMRQEWQLVREPVTWQEAIQAWVDGKTIKCDYPPNDMKLISTTFFPQDLTLTPKREALITGTWYIED